MKSLFFIFALIFLMLAMIFYITGRLLNKSNRNFKKNMRYGQAEVIGYDREEGSDWHTLVVKLCGISDKNSYNCKSKKINIAEYPKGKRVEVVYAPKNIMGSVWYDVRLNEAGKFPTEDGILAKWFEIVGIICLILTVTIFIFALL